MHRLNYGEYKMNAVHEMISIKLKDIKNLANKTAVESFVDAKLAEAKTKLMINISKQIKDGIDFFDDGFTYERS